MSDKYDDEVTELKEECMLAHDGTLCCVGEIKSMIAEALREAFEEGRRAGLEEAAVEAEKERIVFFTDRSLEQMDHDMAVRKQMRKEVAAAIREKGGTKA